MHEVHTVTLHGTYIHVQMLHGQARDHQPASPETADKQPVPKGKHITTITVFFLNVNLAKQIIVDYYVGNFL